MFMSPKSKYLFVNSCYYMTYKIYLILFLFLQLATGNAQSDQKNFFHETVSEKNDRMQWWRDARFGMFIHWGAYAVYAGEYQGKTIDGVSEWIMDTEEIPVKDYEKVAATFNPVEFDADKWVKLARDAGMKYIVITAKHHDGFCMWDTKTTSYSITAFTPFQKDPLSELSAACNKYGIALGFYYSIMDWHHPEAKGSSFKNYRENYLKPQIAELIQNYNPVILWFDGEWIDEWTEEQGRDLYNFARKLKPSLIINNRVGKGRNGMQGMNKEADAVGDFGTPEQEIVENQPDMDWETCMTMNDSWGFKKNDHKWKTVDELTENLIDITAKGGNFLLNVGPDAKGVIPEPSQKRLLEMGYWININQKAIYHVKSLKRFKDSKSVYLVQNQTQDTIYAISVHPSGGAQTIKGVKPFEGSEIFTLGNPIPLQWKFNSISGLIIDIPQTYQLPSDLAITFVIKGSPFPVSVDPVFLSNTGKVDSPFLFTRSTEISIQKPAGNSEINYRVLNDDIPDTSSIWQIYKRSLLLSKSTTIWARIKEQGKVQSNEALLECVKIRNISEVTLTKMPDPKYLGSGTLSLVDKKRGSEDFNDGYWLGFHGDEFEAIIDLGIQSEISSISVGFLSDQRSWIFLPEKVIFEAGNSKDELVTIRTFDNLLQNNEIRKGVHNFKVDLPDYKARYIRITGKTSGKCPDWHPGANQESWIFSDEIIIE